MSGAGVEKNDLVFDVGAHLGEDSEFYLALGYRVVAVEANPLLAGQLRDRFRREIASGQYVLVPNAIDDRADQIEFYVNRQLSVWGTTSAEWARRNERLGAKSDVIEVSCVPFVSLLRAHGIPHYLKVDIEGADMQCIEALRGFAGRPRYLSLESTKVSWRDLVAEFDLLESLGYREFKVIDQRAHARLDGEYRSLSGTCFAHCFPKGSSGPFGEDLPGPWLSKRQAISRYRWIFVLYKLMGDNTPAARLLGHLPLLRRLLRLVSWHDTHARYG